VNLNPDVQAKLDRLASEMVHTREMLDRRYDEMATGRVEGIDGEEARRLLIEKTQVRRQQRLA
jgi:hypothetical protein